LTGQVAQHRHQCDEQQYEEAVLHEQLETKFTVYFHYRNQLSAKTVGIEPAYRQSEECNDEKQEIG